MSVQETAPPANGNGKHHNPSEPGVRSLGPDWAEFAPLVQQTLNSYSNRLDYFQRLMDPRRDLDRECGYPATYAVGSDFYRQLYDRDPIAARVVQLMPKECWQMTPRIYEDEDSKTVTEFEAAWDNLGAQLSPEKSWYQDEEGSLVWEYLRRADEMSGIGSFGVILLGLDDGKDLREPVEGLVSDKYVRDRKGFAKPHAAKPMPKMPKPAAPEGGAPGGGGGFPPKGGPPAPGGGKPPFPPQGGKPPQAGPPSPPKPPATNAYRVDPRKLSIPTPMPDEKQLDEMILNSFTPPMSEWKEGGSVGNKHVDQGVAQTHKVDPRFVRNEDGTVRLELVRNGEVVTNEIKTADQVLSGGTDAQYFSSVGVSSKSGTDAQYLGVQLGPTQYPVEEAGKKELNLTFIRIFDEALVQIVQYEANVRNPRFSRPVMYRITFNDPREQHSGIGLPVASIYVHWTRIVHLADTGNGVSSEIFAAPRMRAVLNPILDGRKIAGAGAEGYWQSCFAGIVLTTHPQLGGEVDFSAMGGTEGLKNMMENYMNSLQRFMILSGMNASTIAPTVTDPTPHADLQVKRICIQLGCPKRVFEGSERGELASSQDDSAWNDRVGSRCVTYVTPRVICPFVDRLILLGVLPEPKMGYRVEWPDLDSTTKKDKATIAQGLTTAMAAYVSGGIEAVMTFRDYLVHVWDWDEELVEEIQLGAIQAHEEEMTQTMPPKGEDGHPATVKPPQPPGPMMLNPGQTMVPHPDNPNAAKQKPFTAPGKPAPTIAPPAGPPVTEKPVAPAIQGRSQTKNEVSVTDNWCNQYGGDTCKEGGDVAHEEGTRESPIHCGHDIKLAAKLLAEGKHIVLNQPEQVATLVTKLGKMLEKAIEKGEKVPKVDLCKVSVPGSNLFCQETIGVPRAQMPQMRGQPVKGSYADTKGRVNKDGKVDVTQEFIKHMYDNGVKSSAERIPMSHLRASQNEIDGARVAELVGKADRGKDLLERPIFVTRDNYVLDGHHHWAADTVLGLRAGQDTRIPVVKLDIDIGTGITMANDFARSAGIAPKTVGADAGSPRGPRTAMTGRSTTNVERIDMPQIRKKHWQSFLAYAGSRTSVTSEAAVNPHDLHAVQTEYDQGRVDAMPDEKLEHPILVSRDGYVLDGNHRWIRAGQSGAKIPVVRLGLDRDDALALMRQFPKAEFVENRWITLPSGTHIEIDGDGDIAKGPKIGKKDDESSDKMSGDQKHIPTATLLPGAGGYDQGSVQEKAYKAGEAFRGGVKRAGRAVGEALKGLGRKAARSETGQRVREEFREAGGVVREAVGKVGGFFKGLRKRLGLSKNEFREFRETPTFNLLVLADALAKGIVTLNAEPSPVRTILKTWAGEERLVFNEAGADERWLIGQALSSHQGDDWFETLLHVAIEETQGDVAAAVKFAEQYYAMNPDGGYDDDTGDFEDELDDDLTDNANPEGCNQYKPCSTGVESQEKSGGDKAAKKAELMAKREQVAAKVRAAKEAYYAAQQELLRAENEIVRLESDIPEAPPPKAEAKEDPYKAAPKPSTPEKIASEPSDPAEHLRDALKRSGDRAIYPRDETDRVIGKLRSLSKDELIEAVQGTDLFYNRSWSKSKLLESIHKNLDGSWAGWERIQS